MHCFHSDSKIHSDPKRARHCSPQYALPHLKVGRCREISKLVIWQKILNQSLWNPPTPATYHSWWTTLASQPGSPLELRWVQFWRSNDSEKTSECDNFILRDQTWRDCPPGAVRPLAALEVSRIGTAYQGEPCYFHSAYQGEPRYFHSVLRWDSHHGLSGWASLFSLSPEMGLPSWECPFSAFWKSNYKFHNRALVKKFLEAFDT